MDDIEQHLNTIVERYREQIRSFTDRISQIEASNKKLREENKKLREACKIALQFGTFHCVNEERSAEQFIKKALEE